MKSDRKNQTLAASLLLLLAAPQVASAQTTEPAVEAFNGKISVEGGRYGNTSGSVLGGSVTAPLGHAFGVQIDAGTGRYLNSNYRGFGSHTFWRNPSIGLVGFTALSAKLGSDTQRRAGLEAEAYLTNFSIRLRAGRQTGTVENGGYGGVQGRWYATPNLALTLGNEDAPGQNTTKLGIEWQPGSSSAPGLAFFAEHENTTDSRNRTVVGLRYYFGSNKTLIKRHRTDDPDTLLPDGPTGLITAVRNRAAAAAAAPPPKTIIPNPYWDPT